MSDSQFFSTLLITHILQFSIVILAAGVIVRLTGRRWPHFAFLVCMVALLKSLMPPVFSSPTGLFSMNPSLALSTEVDVATFNDKIRHSLSPIRESSSEVLPDMMTASVSGNAVESSVLSWAGNLPWVPILVGVWFLGVIFFSGRATWQIIRLRQLIGQQRRGVPGFVNQMIGEIREELSLRRRVDVLISESNEGPAIIGFVRPILILPRVLVSHSTGNQLRPIIAHELVHARRGDAMWGVLQFCAEVVWWFHPFVWWLGRRANMLCERCCDEEAIAGLRCSAADYAESLVRVVAMRNVFRPVPYGNSLSASEVTGQRLERLMKRCGRFSERTPVLTWLVMMGLAVMLLPGAAWGEPEEPDSNEPLTEISERINSALKEQKWTEAVKYLRIAVEKEPSDARATFMLGYVLHMQGRYIEAVQWHRKAAEFDQFRPTALYNWACALNLTGEPAEALEKLEAAVAAGFRHETDIADDPDFQSLLDSERFQKLRARARRHYGNDSKRAFDFWVGEWEVLDDAGRKLGVNVVTREENGHLLIEKWHSTQGGSGTSQNFLSPVDSKWHQHWVDSNGRVSHLKGAWKSDRMYMEGTSVDESGTSKQVRMSLTPRDDKRVLQHIEESEDGGNTWAIVFDGVYHPIGSSIESSSAAAEFEQPTVHAKTRKVDFDE